MAVIVALIIIVFLSITLIPLVSVQWKAIITMAAVSAIAILSSLIAFHALSGTGFETVFRGSWVTGVIPVRIDALSGWFILIINFTFITGAIYGMQYMKPYRSQKANLSVHCINYILLQAGLISICSLQNSIAFLVAWEIMAISSFLLIIFDHEKKKTLDAGINYLIQAHIAIMFLTLGFIWPALKMNSYDFRAISLFTTTDSLLTGFALFFCFFIGFAIKAGFVPFHTWLPYAHPAAPSHVSGIMSGVIIKIGIYGILRMLLLIKTDYLVIGYVILFISIISGIYGVMLAIIQHNLKRLLAYHSIENIGIIGMGIGLGCIGIGKGNTTLTILGFAGALLHSLNHSLFKSILFYGAGNVYQVTHTMDIEQLGGLGKQMPRTALLFLIAALAICGFPPFNGFISEFLVYNGMFTGLHDHDKTLLTSIVFGLFGLALIGGLASLCFTKAFGAVFLGRPRNISHRTVKEASFAKLLPMYAGVFMILAIGFFPKIFIAALSKSLDLFTRKADPAGRLVFLPVTETLSMIGICGAGFLALAVLIYILKRRVTMNKPIQVNTTWACGYIAPTIKMQYTASSFIRSYRKLAEPALSIHKKKKEITGVFPKTGGQETHPYDKVEEWFIDYPLSKLKIFLNRFIFLQNGNLQFYLLYGVVFITLVLCVPLAFEYIKSLFKFLNHL
ncbi:MAG: proton-conducting transporter membrane subunit [Bacteroidota bacterium]|nr:proton-conducting transporter membrane subunit [Bacteroidota bacterium]